jgi:TatA/E family protein of Tat protein translocase
VESTKAVLFPPILWQNLLEFRDSSLLRLEKGIIIGAMQLGFPEMIFIFLLALLIFGPKKLPEVGRQIGKALGEFKRASNEFKSQLETEMRNLELDEASKKFAETPTILSPERTVAIGTAASMPEESASKTTDA